MMRAGFVEIKRPENCPVCGYHDRCKRDGTGAILCSRQQADEVNGYRRLKTTGECSTYVARDRFVEPGRGKVNDGSDLEATMKRYQARATEELIRQHAEGLGVSANSLRACGIGIDDDRRPCFPEVNAAGNVTAINHRQRSGKKLVGKGQKRGGSC